MIKKERSLISNVISRMINIVVGSDVPPYMKENVGFFSEKKEIPRSFNIEIFSKSGGLLNKL